MIILLHLIDNNRTAANPHTYFAPLLSPSFKVSKANQPSHKKKLYLKGDVDALSLDRPFSARKQRAETAAAAVARAEKAGTAAAKGKEWTSVAGKGRHVTGGSTGRSAGGTVNPLYGGRFSGAVAHNASTRFR